MRDVWCCHPCKAPGIICSCLCCHGEQAKQAGKEYDEDDEEAPPSRPASSYASVRCCPGCCRDKQGQVRVPCKEHPNACGMVVHEDDAIIHIQKEQILVEDFLAGKGKMKEEMALTIYWVLDGIDQCHIGFLPKAYIPLAKLWDGILCQVVFVRLMDAPSLIVHQKYHHNCGYVCMTVISALPSGIKVFDDKYDSMIDDGLNLIVCLAK
jgi:hypothetical protein